MCVAELPKSPEWKSSSDPGKDERFESESEGKQIRLDCRAKGKPTPKVIWLKDGQIIAPENDRVQVCNVDVIEANDVVVVVGDLVFELSDILVDVVKDLV